MKKTMKKLVGIAMICALTCSMLTACGSKKVGGIDGNGNYVPGDLLKLTVWETQGTDYAAPAVGKWDIVANWLREKTNVTIENMYGNDGGQWDTKLTKLVAGDNMPHIVHCGGYQGPAHFSKLDELNQAWELTPEMIQTYAPEVWKRTPADYWEKMSKDGKILGIPFMMNLDDAIFPEASEEEKEIIRKSSANYTDVTYTVSQFLWVRDDILKDFFPQAKNFKELEARIEEKGAPLEDELLDIPIYSTDEFIKFMYDIKNANYTENGKKVYAFGYHGGTDNWCALSWLGADMYGYKTHFYTSTWNENTQSIEIPLVGDLIKQAAKTQTKMIRDGVIEEESLVHTTAQYKEKVLNGQYAIAGLSAIAAPDTINDELKKAGKSFRYRPFITQVPAQKDYPAYKERTYWAESICLLKTLSEEEVHQVLNWINVQYTDEYDKVRNWGPEEAGLYTTAEDGRPIFKDDRFNKYFIEGDTSALPEEKDRLGLGGKGGLMKVTPVDPDRWTPKIVYHDKAKVRAEVGTGFSFTTENEHVKNVKEFPPANVWSSIYAGIPEVETYWSARDQWESKFKIAFTAKSDEDFDKKWQSAVEELNNIVDISTLEKKMTGAAKDYANIK